MGLTCEAVARATLGEPLRREGAELIWRCTNTERHRNGDAHPSLKVNPHKNVWACFPCAESGTAWQLAAWLARLDPGDKAGITAWLKERALLNGKQPAKAANAHGHGPCIAAVRTGREWSKERFRMAAVARESVGRRSLGLANAPLSATRNRT
jgi:hypothetical protein